MADILFPVTRTIVTMPDYVRAVVRCWPLVGEDIPLEQSIAVLWAQYMIETGGRACWNWNIGNAKHVKGDGHDYHMLNGVWEGVSTAVAQQLIAAGQAVADPSADHAKAVGANRVSIVFSPPHQATWFRAYKTLDAGMSSHLKLLAKRFTKSWPAVLEGDFVAFAHLLRSQGYFTASAESYAAGMRLPFNTLIASTTYEELVATPTSEPETQPEDVQPEEAEVWDRDGEIAKLVTVMHQGASGLIIEDLLAERERKMREDI
jgi:hypothetical protein